MTDLENARIQIEREFEKLEELSYRQAYFETHLKSYLATQIRALRDKKTQSEFGKIIGKPQNIISRLENENYGKLSIQTLIDIAKKMDIALLVQFTDFSTFVERTNNFKIETLSPRNFTSEQIHRRTTFNNTEDYSSILNSSTSIAATKAEIRRLSHIFRWKAGTINRFTILPTQRNEADVTPSILGSNGPKLNWSAQPISNLPSPAPLPQRLTLLPQRLH